MRGLSKQASRTTKRGHSQGVSTIEVAHEQAAVAVALDEVVSTTCASGATTSFIRERTPSDPLEYPVEVRGRAHPKIALPLSSPPVILNMFVRCSCGITPRHLERSV
jgi:hypothetical protein